MKERWIAVIAAEEQELAGMDGFMEERRTESGAAGCVYRIGRVGSHQVAAMRCGIGKVNAAVSAQAMIDRFQPEALINIGAAGAVAPGLSLYDLVISEDVVQHDMDVTGWAMRPALCRIRERVSSRQIRDSLCWPIRRAPRKGLRRTWDVLRVEICSYLRSGSGSGFMIHFTPYARRWRARQSRRLAGGIGCLLSSYVPYRTMRMETRA